MGVDAARRPADARAMKVARTKQALRHLKTKRKRAKDKRRRRATRGAGDETMVTTADGGGGERDGDDGTDALERSARERRSAVTARKRELRARIDELKSKRGKIWKKNFGKSEERKALTRRIQALEKERAALNPSGGSENGMGEDDGGGGDLIEADLDVEMAA